MEPSNLANRILQGGIAGLDPSSYHMHIEAIMEAYGVGMAKELALWGTNGKSGKEPLKWVRLVDCETDHLEAILRTQAQVKGSSYQTIIQAILAERTNYSNAPLIDINR